MRKRKSGKMSKHDALVYILANSMKEKTVNGLPLYSTVVDHFDYKIIGNGYGEADIIGLARDKPYAVVVEVKTHDNGKARSKAYRQLEKGARYARQAFGVERVFKIYAYWDGDRVATEWIGSSYKP